MRAEHKMAKRSKIPMISLITPFLKSSSTRQGENCKWISERTKNICTLSLENDWKTTDFSHLHTRIQEFIKTFKETETLKKTLKSNINHLSNEEHE